MRRPKETLTELQRSFKEASKIIKKASKEHQRSIKGAPNESGSVADDINVLKKYDTLEKSKVVRAKPPTRRH